MRTAYRSTARLEESSLLNRRLAALIACSLAACGGGTVSPIAEADYTARFSQAFCARLLACCAGQSGAPTVAACESTWSAFVQAGISQSHATGRVTYDSAAAGCEVTNLLELSCGALFAAQTLGAARCGPLYVGTQANGAACSAQTGDEECKSMLCLSSSGTCAPQGAIGKPCPPISPMSSNEERFALCVAGSYVSISSAGTCTCAATLPDGTACTPFDHSCSSGYCDGTAHACAEPPLTLSAGQCHQYF